MGVTPEPDVRRRVLRSTSYDRILSRVLMALTYRLDKDWAFLVFVSDGITSVAANDEIVDLARNAKDPRTAAQNILSYAEEMGSEDNATVMVVPLAGWGAVRGPDRTYERRVYRKKQAVGSERQRRM